MSISRRVAVIAIASAILVAVSVLAAQACAREPYTCGKFGSRSFQGTGSCTQVTKEYYNGKSTDHCVVA